MSGIQNGDTNCIPRRTAQTGYRECHHGRFQVDGRSRRGRVPEDVRGRAVYQVVSTFLPPNADRLLISSPASWNNRSRSPTRLLSSFSFTHTKPTLHRSSLTELAKSCKKRLTRENGAPPSFSCDSWAWHRASSTAMLSSASWMSSLIALSICKPPRRKTCWA